MKDKKYILFDLDGTLTDPKTGITKSVQYSLKAFDIHVTDIDSLISFIGPPLRDSYKKYYGFNDEKVENAVVKYREYFSEKGIFENTPYQGIDTMLENLHNAGKYLIVATSKPVVYAEKILKHFNLHQYFCFISGSELDGRRSKKSEVLRYALENMNISEHEECVMVGDREHDIIGAKEIGMESIGVLYGYGDFFELKSVGATLIAENVNDLTKMLVSVV
ncbi:MAG: HAD family hydrolase [Clostridiales bacterium]|jgi:phosphoglycolate phosphatase|nr:HAD family hydrolase [Clostridiales bacterium]